MVYYPAAHFDFISYDDPLYVTGNRHVQEGLSWDTVEWAFQPFYPACNWHPLTWLSHALDCQVFGANSGAHHAMSFILHALNAVLLFWVLLRATGFAGRSFVVAALFAFHPFNVESVAWISERKTVLSMLFFLLALGAYRWYAREPRLGRCLTVATLYALGLMAKPQIITFPFVLLLWDYWPLQRISFGDRVEEGTAPGEFPSRTIPQLLWEKLPLLVLSLASAALTMPAQQKGGATAMTRYPLWLRVENAVVSYVQYIAKAFWPTRLAALYPYPMHSITLWAVGGAALLLLAITFFAVESRDRRYLAVGWFWYLGTLVPMIGLVQVGEQAMADRYTYLPLVGIYIMVCWMVADWCSERRISPLLLAGVSAAVLLTLAGLAHRQVGYWRNGMTLWSHAADVTRDNWVVEDHLGDMLKDKGKTDEAMTHFLKAENIFPNDYDSNLQIGTFEQEKGNMRGAIDHYKKVINTKGVPVDFKVKAFNNMCYAYRGLGDAGLADKCFAQLQRISGQ